MISGMMRAAWMLAVIATSVSGLCGQDEKWSVEAEHGPSRTVEFELSEGTWMNLDVSPNGSTIVFDLLGDIWALPIGGGEASPLITGPAMTVQPRYSANGRYLAFTSDAGGGDNLWIANADGSAARQVTDEDFRLLNNPCWTPDGNYLIGRKHFTSGRSLGAGELWMYSRKGGEGVQLVEKRDEQHDLGEPEISPDGRYVYYSQDVSPGKTFEYDRDPNGLIYAIKRLDLETGEIITLLSDKGGSARPEVSPDGERLAFVRRLRGKTVLYLLDLQTGEQTALWDGLSKDGQEAWSIFGVHPGFAWMPDGESIVVQADGGIWRVAVDTGEVSAVPFTVKARHRIRDALRFAQDIGGEQIDVRTIRWPCISPNGQKVIYQALGHLWSRDLREGAEPKRLTDAEIFEFWPTLSPDGHSVAYTTWDDREGGRVMLLSLLTNERRAVVKIPGHYVEPCFDQSGQRLLYRRLGHGGSRGTEFTLNPGIYLLNLETGRSRFVTRDGSRPRFHPSEDRILVLDSEGEDRALISLSMLGHDRRVLATSAHATDILLSPDGKVVAWEELYHVHLSPMPRLGKTPHRLDPGRKDLPVVKLTRDGGEFLSFSPSGQQLYHSLASRLQRNEVARALDHDVDGVPEHESWDLTAKAAADIPDSDLLLEGAKIITMKGQEILESGAIWVVGNRIRAIGALGSFEVGEDTRRIDCGGRVIVPGFVDVHAHMTPGSNGMMPQANWPYLANLSYGVTTTHDPSCDTKLVFSQHELVETGQVLGPRIFSTGTILYGAEAPFKAVIDELDDARAHLRRLRAFGAFTVKSYNQPRREQRQMVIDAAAELEMMVVPEGGSMFFHNLSMILDGHTSIEHALPVVPLKGDVLSLFAASKTAYHPTLVVGYGGLGGENYWYEVDDVWADQRLMRWVPRAMVDARSRRRNKYPTEELHHVRLAHGAAKLEQRGVLCAISAHGQMQGICSHWDLWMFHQGGMDQHRALMCATIHGARSLGLDAHIGSLEPGKLADLLILDDDPLEDIRNSTSIRRVMKNGRLYDGMSLEQIHPTEAPSPELPDIGRLTDDGTSCGCCRHD